MAFNWTNKGSDKHNFQKVLFESSFQLELCKNNLKTIKKQSHENKVKYQELFNLYHHDDCFLKAFEYKNNAFIKYLINLPDNLLKNKDKLSSQLMFKKICKCGKCEDECFNPLNWKKDHFIFMAAEYGNQEIIEWLITEKGISLDILNKYQENILYYAACNMDLTLILIVK